MATKTLTMKLTGAISSQYNYVTSSYESLSVPSTVTVLISTPLEPTYVNDYGTTTIVQFPLGAAHFTDPLASYVGHDPVGNGLADLGKSAYAFTDTSDYSSTFLTEAAAQDNIYHNNGSEIFSYHTEIRLQSYSPSLGGTGLADYALQDASLRSYLTSLLNQPMGYYNSSWSVYTLVPGGGVAYSAGFSWSSYSMTLTQFSISGLAVPEPATWLFMIGGFGMIAAMLRRRRDKLQAV